MGCPKIPQLIRMRLKNFRNTSFLLETQKPIYSDVFVGNKSHNAQRGPLNSLQAEDIYESEGDTL